MYMGSTPLYIFFNSKIAYKLHKNYFASVFIACKNHKKCTLRIRDGRLDGITVDEHGLFRLSMPLCSNQIKSALFIHHISQKDESGVFTIKDNC